MNKIVFLFFAFVSVGLSNLVFSQHRFNANDKNIFFAQISYNRSGYTHPDVEFSTSTYKATLENVRLSDDVDGVKMGRFFSGSSPQFNIKIGYYVADKWAITAGFDRYNTFFVPNQTVVLNGYFSPQTNHAYSGEINQSIHLDGENFNLMQKNGLNFFSVGVQRNDQLFKTRRGGFAFQLVYGAKIGGILSSVSYTYQGHTTENISSLSGIGIGLNLDLQFVLARYLFLAVGAEGGWFNQNKIKLTTNTDVIAKEKIGYFSPHLTIGFAIPAGGDNCGTCPKW